MTLKSKTAVTDEFWDIVLSPPLGNNRNNFLRCHKRLANGARGYPLRTSVQSMDSHGIIVRYFQFITSESSSSLFMKTSLPFSEGLGGVQQSVCTRLCRVQRLPGQTQRQRSVGGHGMKPLRTGPLPKLCSFIADFSKWGAPRSTAFRRRGLAPPWKTVRRNQKSRWRKALPFRCWTYGPTVRPLVTPREEAESGFQRMKSPEALWHLQMFYH